jgi:polyphosphate kinase
MGAGKSTLINRELSWLDFNQRVLDEATDPATPLLERLNFLSITASNLDEFFMVRVGGLLLLAEAGVTRADASGLTPARQLRRIGERAHRMFEDQYALYRDVLSPALAEAGIRRVEGSELTGEQGEYVEWFFEREVFPIVTPMAVPSSAEFPLLVNLGLNVVVRLKPAPGRQRKFAVIPLGSGVDRLVRLPSRKGHVYVTIEDVVRCHAGRFFPGETVLECVPFRITRNADLTAREDAPHDFLSEMEEVLSRRRKSGCVRLEIDRSASDGLLKFLRESLQVEADGIYAVGGPLALCALRALASSGEFPALRYAPWPAQPSPQVDLKRSIFDEISRHPILLYHPYDSYEPVLRLVEQAAGDPDVLAIKQILYRTSTNSPIVRALKRAAEAGKYVTALVELKARFDEARNIEWARELEECGVQVIYGVKGLKTHAKICIVTRREAHGVVRYLHFGTGNYNERTARLYCDVSYMTRDEDLGADASTFFNAISGYSEPRTFLKLEAAPIGLREKLLELIDGEAMRRKQGQPARIMAKLNSLVDHGMIKALYRASRAGVKIDLNVRGICCLRPGVKGLSENISVVSIVDRYLEHARVLYFHQGGEGKAFISSADWMPRNLDRRVELLVPVDDPVSRRRLIAMLETSLRDNVKGRRLFPDGAWRLPELGKEKPFRSQEATYLQACQAVKEAESARRTVFEPHLPADANLD